MEPVETIAPVETKPIPVGVTSEPRNFLATFLLACSFGVLGLRHFYLGDKKLGWIRTGLFAGGYIWMFLMAALGQLALLFVGVIAILVAAVWAIVDFFYVYNAVKTDAQGQPLTVTARDKKWAKVIYLVVIISVALSIILSIVSASFAENSFKNYLNNTPTDGTNSLNIDSYEIPQQAY